MRALVLAALAGCAATAKTCPTDSQFASADRPSGHVEWCAAATNAAAELPSGRAFPSLLGMAHPTTASGAMRGPFTHWYPSGAVESHGSYAADGSPDGVWGFWYPDGQRETLGRYEHGKPVGCFAMWDEHGAQVTGVADGDQLRVERCEPPADVAIEPRAHHGDEVWGDLALDTVGQAGAFGAKNASQRDGDPAARATAQLAVRKHVGNFRFGGALAYRLANTDDAHAYAARAVAAYALPTPSARIDAELEASLGVQRLDITARRMDVPGTADVGLWAPLGGVRLAAAFAITPTIALTLGASVDGFLAHDTTEPVQYCAPFCAAPIMETWRLGGAAYGADLGLRLTLR